MIHIPYKNQDLYFLKHIYLFPILICIFNHYYLTICILTFFNIIIVFTVLFKLFHMFKIYLFFLFIFKLFLYFVVRVCIIHLYYHYKQISINLLLTFKNINFLMLNLYYLLTLYQYIILIFHLF